MFENFIKEMNESHNLLELEEGWDGMNAKRVNTNALIYAHIFLWEIINKSSIDIIVPEINPCASGAVDISWRNNDTGYKLLVCFNQNEFLWYGHNRHNGESKDRIKGTLEYSVFKSHRSYDDLLKYIKIHFEQNRYNIIKFL